MIAAISKWGNSLALRIPNAFARELDVSEGTSVEVAVVDGTLVIRPVDETHTYDLDVLVGQITDENRHGEIAAGGSVGSEI